MLDRIEKYRPYLTLDDLKALAAAVRLLPDIPRNLMTYLDRYIVDIELKTRGAAALTHPTIAARLELEQKVKLPEDYRYNPETLYDMYISNKCSFTGMDAKQIGIVKEHMIQFMSPEELSEMINAGASKISPAQALKNAGLPPEEEVL